VKIKKQQIRNFTLNKLREGWSKQEIFDHLLLDLENEVKKDYRRIRQLAVFVAKIPSREVKKNLSLILSLLIVLTVGQAIGSFVLSLPVTQIYGTFELPWYIALVWILVWNFFGLISLILLIPAIRFNMTAFLWLAIIGFFQLIRGLWEIWMGFGEANWLIILVIIFHLFAGFAALTLYRKTPDSFSIDSDKSTTGNPWRALFHKTLNL
jgi:hypothetical protein